MILIVEKQDRKTRAVMRDIYNLVKKRSATYGLTDGQTDNSTINGHTPHAGRHFLASEVLDTGVI